MEIIVVNEKSIDEIINKYSKRNEIDIKSYRATVDEILEGVKNEGDGAVLNYTLQFDKVDLRDIGMKVTEDEIEEAFSKVEEQYIKAIEEAKKNIWKYHLRQLENSWFTADEEGILLGQKVTPLHRVGIYVPGGTAPYPSSVLMNGIPPIIAGVKEIVMITPPLKDGTVNPGVLAAAKVLGIKEIYKIGGAQGIGALAFGTETIKRVDKIVGPGNIYVATAKRLVFGHVDIDMVAGPSEILIIADDTANPEYVAADLLSQAEHDTMASSICVTTSVDLGKKIKDEVNRQLMALDRRDMAQEAIKNNGEIIVVSNLEEAIHLSNCIAPEHLQLCINEPFEALGKVENAGAVFVGNYAPEALGDYMAGPNHVLPTSGTARFFSPLSVNDFIKKTSIIYYSKEALNKIKNDVMLLARLEKLTAHENSIAVRFR